MERMEVGSVVRRRPYASSRRRTRSTSSLPPPLLPWQRGEDSSSSKGGGLSDSDDVQPMGLRQPYPSPSAHHLMESDSVNENFSPVRPSTRRKRKFKRLAVDAEMVGAGGGGGGGGRPPMSCMLVSSGKKKRVLRHVPNCDNRYCLPGLSSGKRKRSVRTEQAQASASMAVGFAQPDSAASASALPLHRLSLREPMEVCGGGGGRLVASGSSVSSSESDTGVFTNDEGREGDDEQSDWFGGEAKGGGDDMESPTTTTIQGWGGRGRELRGGRRRQRGSERASFSVFTSANEQRQLSKFLQDPARSHLKLEREREREGLSQLADLYSLSMHRHHATHCPVLTKTSNTVRVEQLPMSRLNSPGDVKRRRSGHRSSPPDHASPHHHLLQGHKSS